MKALDFPQYLEWKDLTLDEMQEEIRKLAANNHQIADAIQKLRALNTRQWFEAVEMNMEKGLKADERTYLKALRENDGLYRKLLTERKEKHGHK